MFPVGRFSPFGCVGVMDVQRSVVVFGSRNHQSLAVRTVTLQRCARHRSGWPSLAAFQSTGRLQQNGAKGRKKTTFILVRWFFGSLVLYRKIFGSATLAARVAADHGRTIQSSAGWNIRTPVSSRNAMVHIKWPVHSFIFRLPVTDGYDWPFPIRFHVKWKKINNILSNMCHLCREQNC